MISFGTERKCISLVSADLKNNDRKDGICKTFLYVRLEIDSLGT